MKIFRVDRKGNGFDEIAEALQREFGIYLVEVPDTGTDDHYFVLDDCPMTSQEAQHHYDIRE